MLGSLKGELHYLHLHAHPHTSIALVMSAGVYLDHYMQYTCEHDYELCSYYTSCHRVDSLAADLGY